MFVLPPIGVSLLPGARRAVGPARGLVSPFAVVSLPVALPVSGARVRAPTPPPVSVPVSVLVSVLVSASAATPTVASALLSPAEPEQSD